MRVRFMLLPMVAALPLVSLTATLITTPAAAQAAEEARQFEIAAGPLSDVLTRFATETGISLSFDSSLAAGKTSPGLSGRFDVDQALRRLLSGTGLEAVRAVEGGYRLAVQPPVSGGVTMMQAVQVQATTSDPTMTENTRSYTTPAVSVGGKTAREPRQIQQQVTVVTAQRIRDQALTTAEEAIGQAVGVTVGQNTGYSTNATFYSRGFAMAMQMDGGAVNVNNLWYNTGLPDMAIVDHIEVLRGSDGLFTGSGSPGGTVNIVRKRPLDHKQVTFDALAASWDRYRTQVDVSSPLAFDGKLRGRFAAAEEKRHYFYDTASSEKSVLYGVLEADLTDSTLFTVGTSYEQLDRNGLFWGLPRYLTGADLELPRSTCLCTDWSGRDDEVREMFARIEQQYGDHWKLKLNVGQQWVSYQYKQGNVVGGTGINPITGVGASLQASRTDASNITKLADITLDGVFKVFGLQQEIVLGWNWQDMFSDGNGVSLSSTQQPVDDVFAFGSRDFAEPGTPASYVGLKPFGGQRQSGTYVTLRSEWFEGFHSVTGLRSSNFNNRYAAAGFYSKQNNVRTPYAGLSYDITQAMTTYFSYAQIYQAQPYSLGVDGKPIDPIEGDTYELGIKGSWFGGNLNAQAALYQVERRNAAVQISNPRQYCCYIGGAEIESRGFDAELVGQLLPGWDLQLGYTYNINEYKSGYGSNNGASYSPRTPKHLVKLWSMVKLPGDWSEARVGGGVNWQSTNYVAGSVPTYNPESDKYDGDMVPFKYSQKAYAVVSLRGEYKLDPNWLVALNVNNLFDETYYQTVSTTNMGNYYGEPRNWILSLSGRW